MTSLRRNPPNGFVGERAPGVDSYVWLRQRRLYAEQRTDSGVYPDIRGPASAEILRTHRRTHAQEEYAGGVTYESGGTEVFMYPTSNAGTSRASQAAYWQVDDVEAEMVELKSRGVVFEQYDMPGVEMRNGIAVAGGAKTAWFKDTEGNILAISQRL
jgi:hypothetical protein